jgi:hypothetical protein
MSTVPDIEKLALDLPEQQRATLAASLLDSLPAVLSDDDEGIAEALRRDTEMNTKSDQSMSLAELDSHIIKERRG